MTALMPAEASSLTEPFWEAAARQILVRPVCDACGTSFFVPQIACPRCHAETWTYRPSSGRGTLSTFTIVHRAPTAEHAPPYVVGIIDLDEGWFMMSNVVGCRPDTVVIGQRVEVVFETRADGVVLPRFRPCAEGSK